MPCCHDNHNTVIELAMQRRAAFSWAGQKAMRSLRSSSLRSRDALHLSSIILYTCQPSRIFRDYPGNSSSIPDSRIVVRKSRIFRLCIGNNLIISRERTRTPRSRNNTYLREHCCTRGRILNDVMPAFNDSVFTFSSDSNSLVEPPVKRPRHTHSKCQDTWTFV